MKKFLFVALFLATGLLGSPAYSANGENCAVPLRSACSALRDVPGGIARHEFYEEAKIVSGDVAAVKQLARDLGVELDSEYFVDYVDGVFRKLKAEGGDPVQQGEKMAQFGKKLEPYIEKLSKEARKSAGFSIADAVMTLEEFKPEEFKPAERLNWIESHAPFVHSDDYLRYTEGYIDNKEPWTNHPWGGSVINLSDIRDGASHNYFPLQLNPHDMRHIHYATGHPRPLAVYMKTARSHNHMRFMLEGAMYEGVDSVQFYHETQIAQYMANTRHMDLEEAMVFIAKATKEEMDQIIDGANIRVAMESGATSHATWTPTTHGDIQATHNGKPLDQEIDEFVDRHWGYLQRPELRKYTNFATAPGTGANRQKDVILWGGRIQEINSGTLNAPEAAPGTVGAPQPQAAPTP
jgi:hypothetical protein